MALGMYNMHTNWLYHWKISISPSIHNQKNEKANSINVGLLQNDVNSSTAINNEQISPSEHNKTTIQLELQKEGAAPNNYISQ